MKYILPVFVLLLAACSPQPQAPIKVVVKDGGRPVSWDMGDRIRVEGKISETGGGDYILRNVSGSGHLTNENCFLLKGLEAGWGMLRLRAALLANSGRPVAVTGMSIERFPLYPTPGSGQHQRGMCLASIQLDGLVTL